MNTETILNALKKRYTNYGAKDKYVCFPELRMGTGYEGTNETRVDFFVMALWPSDRYEKTAFEIKVSRSDFLREMKKPLKRRPALSVSNTFYFAAPKGMLKIEEIPVECGLLEFWESEKSESKMFVKDSSKYINMSKTIPAPWRDYAAPNWAFIASLARRIARMEQEAVNKS